jgi:hypothetical protein
MDNHIELEIGPGSQPGRYQVRVLSSSVGGGQREEFPLDVEALMSSRPHLEASILASAVGARRVGSQTDQPIRAIGQHLFESIFTRSVHRVYRDSVAVAQQRGDRLRVVLRFAAPELGALPWETLFDPARKAYLCREEPMVRRIPAQHDLRAPLQIDPPLCVLALAASPRGLPLLDTQREREHLDDALRELTSAGLVEVTWVEPATWRGAHEALVAGRRHVVHFIGHGDYDQRREEGVLAFVGPDGRADLVEAGRFADLLGDADPMPRVVVLNPCSSGASGSTGGLWATAPALVHSGVEAVVAMQFALSDGAAIAFSQGFYSAIAQSRSPGEAALSGRIAMLGAPGSLEWVTPVLYLRGDSARPIVMRPGSRQESHESQELYIEAREELEAGRYDAAVRLLDVLLEAEPSFRDAADLRAQARRRIALRVVRQPVRAMTPPAPQPTIRPVPQPGASASPRKVVPSATPYVRLRVAPRAGPPVVPRVAPGGRNSGPPRVAPSQPWTRPREDSSMVASGAPPGPPPSTIETPTETGRSRPGGIPGMQVSTHHGVDDVIEGPARGEGGGSDGSQGGPAAGWGRRALVAGAALTVVAAGVVGYRVLTAPDTLPDGTLLLTKGTTAREIVRVDVSDGTTSDLVAGTGLAGGGAFRPNPSPDRTKVAYLKGTARRPVLRIRDVDGAHDHAVFGDGDPCVYAARPAWSPDGTELAVVCVSPEGTPAKGLVIVAASDGHEIRELIPARARVFLGPPSWAADVGRGGSVILWQGEVSGTDPREGGPLVEVPVSGAGGEQPYGLAGIGTFSHPDYRDGRVLAVQRVTADDDEIVVFTEHGRRSQVITRGPVDAPTWSPDGEQIAYLRLDDDSTKPELMVRDYVKPGQDPHGRAVAVPQDGEGLEGPVWDTR